jgi:hypothetical protein
MNYCSIEDAWKNNDYITEQFKYKKNIIEKFENENENKIEPVIDHIINNSIDNNINNNTNTKNYDHVFICNDFWDHLNTCSACREKIRNRFSSKIIEKFENVVIDNKDTVLIFLVILFALIFCNLLISIICR